MKQAASVAIGPRRDRLSPRRGAAPSWIRCATRGERGADPRRRDGAPLFRPPARRGGRERRDRGVVHVAEEAYSRRIKMYRGPRALKPTAPPPIDETPPSRRRPYRRRARRGELPTRAACSRARRHGDSERLMAVALPRRAPNRPGFQQRPSELPLPHADAAQERARGSDTFGAAAARVMCATGTYAGARGRGRYLQGGGKTTRNTEAAARQEARAGALRHRGALLGKAPFDAILRRRRGRLGADDVLIFGAPGVASRVAAIGTRCARALRRRAPASPAGPPDRHARAAARARVVARRADPLACAGAALAVLAPARPALLGATRCRTC